MGASFCEPAADYGAETIMWELHTLTVILDFAQRKVVTSQDVNHIGDCFLNPQDRPLILSLTN